MLEWEGTITHVQECLIKLCQVIFNPYFICVAVLVEAYSGVGPIEIFELILTQFYINQVLFGTAVFDHMTFIVPVRDLGINWESAVDHIKDRISYLTGYEKQVLK